MRSEVRSKNLWHRASYIFVLDRLTDKFVIQKRTLLKDYCPGYFDIVTGGVVGAGEDDDLGAERELEEELGLKGHKLEKVAVVKFENEGNRVWGNLYFLKVELKEGDLCL